MDDSRIPLGPRDFNLGAHLFSAQRLKLARELRALTRTDLAAKIDLSPSAITQFEAGLIRPDVQSLRKLSLILALPIDFFALSHTVKLLSSDNCNFRKLRSASQMERNRVLAAGTIIREFTSVLERYISVPREQVTPVARAVRTLDEIEDLASNVRSAWGLGLGPLPNLITLLENKGIIVSLIEEKAADVEAFSTWHEGRPMVFLVSDKQSPSRMRLDAAHELGHLIMHADANPGDQRLEEQAFRFAGAFLIPKEPFLDECPRRLNFEHFYELKQRWKVSVAALIRRAYDLRILSQASYRRAFMYLNKTGQRKHELFEPAAESPTIISESIELLKESMPLEGLARQIGLNEKNLRSVLSLDSNEGLLATH